MQAWQNFLTALESDLGADTVNKWLRNLKVVHFDAGNLYLEASDSFQVAWFEEHARHRARKQLVNNNFNPIKIHLSCDAIDESAKEDPSRSEEEETKPHFKLLKDNIDPQADLKQFVVGESSKFTFELISSLAGINKESPIPTELGQFNPIYIYGAPGCGKTHLLMGLTKELCKKGIITTYVRMETFTENVVNAIRSGNMHEFRNAYRNIDVLIVDDVHQLSKKTATQEEFFHTFNTLHTSGRQIVLSSNCVPAQLQEIEPRLVSRFEWGIPLQLGSLDEDQVSEVIQRRLKHLSYSLKPSTLEHLLKTFNFQLKTLHKAVEALVLRAHTTSKKISSQHLLENDIDQILADLIDVNKQRVLNPQKIVQTVAEVYGIKTEDILGKSQMQECTLPRQIAMYLCRNKINMPYTQIGQFFNRDHSTVISSVSGINEKQRNQDAELISSLQILSKKLDILTEG